MNKVDLHVKQLMLRSPSMFPTRWSVLEHIFLHIGTGYGWTRQGTVASIYEKKNSPMPSGMDMSDLEHEAELLDESAARFKERGLDDVDFDRKQRVSLGMRRVQREYIAANIDVYASEDLGERGVAAKLLPSSLGDTPLGQVPTSGKVDRDWALAADEVTVKLLGYLGHQLSEGNDASLLDWQKKRYEQLQAQARETLAALEPVTKKSAGRQAVAKLFKELLADKV